MWAHVALPPRAVTAPPGILVLQDAFGVTNFLRDVAARFAQLGFVAIAPELYHRTGDGVECPYDDREMVANVPHMEAMTVEGMLADARAAHAWLTADGGVDPARTAAMGFCMGGRLAYLANAQLPLRAAVSLYGRIPPKILDYAATQHGELLMVWGGADHGIPPAMYRAVADALDRGGARHTQVVFSHAPHAFFCHVRDWCYDASASRQTWALTIELLRTTGVLRA